MATFKVGQRVRIVANHGPKREGDKFIGLETTIVGNRWQGFITGWRWYLRIPDDDWFFHSSELAPIADPKANEFIESIKRLEPYEEPKVPNVNAVPG